MKFSIKVFFSKCDQIGRFLRIWSHLLKKSFMKNFIFLCSVYYFINFKRRLWIARNFPETVRFHKISTQEN